VGLVAAAVFNVVMLATETHATPITIDLVSVGNAGNANDTTGYGAVNYARMLSRNSRQCGSGWPIPVIYRRDVTRTTNLPEPREVRVW